MDCNMCFSVGGEGVAVVPWAKAYRGDEEFLIHVFQMAVKFSCSICAKVFPSCCSRLCIITRIVVVLTVRPLTRVIEQREHN